MGAKIKLILLTGIVCVTSGCAVGSAVMGAGSVISSEIRFQKLEDRLKQNEVIIDFLLDEREYDIKHYRHNERRSTTYAN